MSNPYYLLRPSVVLRILLTVTGRIKPLHLCLCKKLLCIPFKAVGFQKLVDLLLLLLVALL